MTTTNVKRPLTKEERKARLRKHRIKLLLKMFGAALACGAFTLLIMTILIYGLSIGEPIPESVKEIAEFNQRLEKYEDAVKNNTVIEEVD